MTETKNLCALIPLDLHNRVTEAKEQLGQTTAEYITNLLTEYFEMKKSGFLRIQAHPVPAISRADEEESGVDGSVCER